MTSADLKQHASASRHGTSSLASEGGHGGGVVGHVLMLLSVYMLVKHATVGKNNNDYFSGYAFCRNDDA